MPNVKIYVYSGTGNCFLAAKQLSALFENAQIIHVSAELVNSKPTIECEKCVLIFPCFAYQSPSLVKRFLKTAAFNVNYFAALVTCGTKIGGTLGEVKRLLHKQKRALDFGMEIPSVENYVHIFGLPTAEKIDERLNIQEEKIAEAAKKIAAGEKITVRSFRPFSMIASFFFRRVQHAFCRHYRVKDTCNGCGLCKSICPTNAIVMRETDAKNADTTRTRPKFIAKKCDHCQACLQWCPQRAIKFWRIKPSSGRYHNPNVNIGELRKR